MTVSKWPAWWNAAWDAWFRAERRYVTPHTPPPPPTDGMLLLNSPAKGPLGAPAVSSALTGTVTTAAAADIVAGGKTIILTVTNDTWVTSGATFNAQRQAIINGLVSAQSETHGWNNEVKAKIAVTDVVRTSNTVVTITLDAESAYAITANETITATIPGSALTLGGLSIAVPTFSIIASAAPPIPTYTGAAGQTLVLQDDVTRYVSVTQMGAVTPSPALTSPYLSFNPSPHETSTPVDTSHVSLITGRNGTGQAVRLTYQGGPSVGGQDQESANLCAILAPAQPNNQTVNVTYYARFTASGWDVSSTALGLKWIEMWHNSPIDNTRHQHHLRYRTNLNDAPIQDQLTYTPGPLNGATVWQILDQLETSRCAGQPTGQFFLNVADGNWHLFTHSFRPNSTNGARDGWGKMWIDGVLCLDVENATIGQRPTGGEKEWGMAQDLDSNIATANGIHHLVWGAVRTTDTGPFTLDVTEITWWTET